VRSSGQEHESAPGGGEYTENETVLMPILGIWAQISTPLLERVWHSDPQQGTGIVAPKQNYVEDGQHHHQAEGSLSCSPLVYPVSDFSSPKCFSPEVHSLWPPGLPFKALLSFLHGQRTTRQFGKNLYIYIYTHTYIFTCTQYISMRIIFLRER